MSGSDAYFSWQAVASSSERIFRILQSNSSSSRDRAKDPSVLREGDNLLRREDNLQGGPWWTVSELFSSSVKESEKKCKKVEKDCQVSRLADLFAYL